MSNKSNQNKFLVILIVFLLISNIAMLLFFVVLDKPKKTESSSEKPVTDYMQRELDLTDSQAVHFRELRDEHKSSVRPMFDSMRADKNRFYDRLSQSAVPDSVLQNEAEAIGNQQAQLELKLYHHLEKLRGLCTPEQRPRFDSLVHKMINRSGNKKKDKK